MSTTLDIIVSAQDRATATINGVAASGQKLGTSLQASGAKGSAAMASVTKTSNTLGSTLKKIGGTIGVVFGVKAVYEFGKAAVDAYEAVQKQQALLKVGLDKIGQSGALPGLVTELGAVSNSTVTLQGTTDGVASAVLNVGHAYFQSLGTQAPAVLAGLTKGIINISAATHKSLSMLQRSLTLAVINTPAKAIPMLQKLGIISADQAVKFGDMAAAGDLVALKQAEVNAVTNAYPGAAGKSATAGERLAKSMDDIKIKVGAVLVPIVEVVAKVADWAAKNSTLAATILGGAGLVYGLTKIVAVARAAAAAQALFSGALSLLGVRAYLAATGLAADVANAVALTASEGVATIATLSLGEALTTIGSVGVLGALGAALAAGLAIGTMLNHVLGISQKLDSVLINDSINSASSINDEVSAMAKLKAAWQAGDITAAQFSSGVAVLNQKYGANFNAAGIMANATRKVGTTVQTVAAKVVKFAGMGQAAFDKWATTVKADAKSQITSLGGVALATKKTAHDFLKASDLMLRVAKQDAAGMRKLASSSQSWVPTPYKQWLIQQGPGAVANFEKLTTKAQHQAVDDFKGASNSADAYSKALNNLSPDKLNAATTAAGRLNSTLDTLRNKSPINIDVYVRQHGHIPGHAAGGDILTPELAMVGEHGPELVALPAGAHVYPSGQGPRSGLTAGGVSRAAERSAPGTIHVSIDRKRWVEQSDFETNYRGW